MGGRYDLGGRSYEGMKLTEGVLRRVVWCIGCRWEAIGSFREKKKRENDKLQHDSKTMNSQS